MRYLLLLAVLFGGGCSRETPSPMTTSAALGHVTATLTLRPAPMPAGAVRVHNGSDADVRVWDLGNSWGDGALTFEATADGHEDPAVIAKRDDLRYTRNVPRSTLVASGASHDVAFDLGDGTWDLTTAREVLARPDVTVRALYASGETPEGEEHGLWQGTLRTDAVPLP